MTQPARAIAAHRRVADSPQMRPGDRATMLNANPEYVNVYLRGAWCGAVQAPKSAGHERRLLYAVAQQWAAIALSVEHCHALRTRPLSAPASRHCVLIGVLSDQSNAKENARRSLTRAAEYSFLARIVCGERPLIYVLNVSGTRVPSEEVVRWNRSGLRTVRAREERTGLEAVLSATRILTGYHVTAWSTSVSAREN